MRSTSTIIAIAAIAATSTFAAPADNFVEARDYANALEARTWSIHPTHWGKTQAQVDAKKLARAQRKVNKDKAALDGASGGGASGGGATGGGETATPGRRDFEELEARTWSIHPSHWGKSQAQVDAKKLERAQRKVDKDKAALNGVSGGGASGGGATGGADTSTPQRRDFEELEARTWSLHPSHWGKTRVEVDAMKLQKAQRKVNKDQAAVGGSTGGGASGGADTSTPQRRDFEAELEARTFSIHPSHWGKSQAEVDAMKLQNAEFKVNEDRAAVGGVRRDVEDDLEARDFDEDFEDIMSRDLYELEDLD